MPTQDDCHTECAASVCNPDCDLYDPDPTTVGTEATLNLSLDREWAQPASVQALLVAQLDASDLALTLGARDFCAQTLSLTWTWPDQPEWEQQAYGMKAMSRADLSFKSRKEPTTLHLAGQEVGFFDSAWSGTLVSGSAVVQDLSLIGLLDVGDLTLDSTTPACSPSRAAMSASPAPMMGCMAVWRWRSTSPPQRPCSTESGQSPPPPSG